MKSSSGTPVNPLYPSSRTNTDTVCPVCFCLAIWLSTFCVMQFIVVSYVLTGVSESSEFSLSLPHHFPWPLLLPGDSPVLAARQRSSSRAPQLPLHPPAPPQAPSIPCTGHNRSPGTAVPQSGGLSGGLTTDRSGESPTLQESPQTLHCSGAPHRL